jgi:hypothetical protein
VTVVGWFLGTVDFGGVPLTSAGFGLPDIFVLKLSGLDGSHVWSKRFGAEDLDFAGGLAVDASGDVTVIGLFGGTVEVGGKSLIGPAMFALKLSSMDGSHLWSHSFDAGRSTAWLDVAVDANGNPATTGYHSTPVDFGGGPHPSSGAAEDILVIKRWR